MVVEQTAWRNIFFLLATGMLGALHFYKLSPALPYVREEFGLSLVEGGWLYSAISLVGMLCGVVAGSVADAFGHKRVILWALVMLGLTSIGASFSGNENLLMIYRLLEGVGFMAVMVAVPSLIAHQAMGSDRAMVMGIWSACMPAGAVFVMLLAPPLLEGFGWRVLWQVAGVISMLMFLAMFFLIFPNMVEEVPVKKPGHLADNIRQIISTPVSWVLVIEFVFFTAIFAGVLAWLPSYLITEKNIDIYLAGWISALVIVMNIIGGLVGGLLLRRGFDPLKLMAVSSLVVAANIVGMMSVYISDGLQLAFCLVFSLVGGIWPGCIYAQALNVVLSTELRGTINGFLINGASLGALVGPLALASMVTVFGEWSAIVWSIAPIALLASFVVWLVQRNHKLTAPVSAD